MDRRRPPARPGEIFDADTPDARVRRVAAEPLTAAAFARYGRVLEARGAPHRLSLEGGRWEDLSVAEASDGRMALSLLRAEARALPVLVGQVRRHVKGTVTLLPMGGQPYLLLVLDEGHPRAFHAAPGQGAELHPGLWHAGLLPLRSPGLFAVWERVGEVDDRMERRLTPPVLVEG